MAPYRRVGTQCRQRAQAPGERHFIVQPVQSCVAEAAYLDSGGQRLPIEMLAKIGTSVDLARHQVVECEFSAAAAETAAAVVARPAHARILGRAGDRIKHVSDVHLQLYAWLARVPPATVVTYGQLAKLIGRPNGARWVGRQLGSLPAGSVLPWHRVVNARGCSSLPLDARGWNRQLRLLQREGVQVVNGRISLNRYRWDPFAG